MMEKRIQASKPVVVKAPDPFPTGLKFINDGTQFTVRRAYSDAGADFRLVYSERNGEEILLLSSLKKLAEQQGFSIIYNPLKKDEK